MKKGYYYMVQVQPVVGGFKYFKANNKLQIKNYLQSINIDIEIIYDPTDKPVEGIYYTDLTK